MSDQRFHFAHAWAREQVGAPTDAHESDRLYWVPVDEVLDLVRDGHVSGCPAMFGLLYAHTFGHLGPAR